MNKSNNSSTTMDNWQKCARWLNEYEVFDEITRQKILSNNLTEKEFSALIQDGLCLVNLLDKFSPPPLSSSQSSTDNLKNFLTRTRLAPFHMTEHQLFSYSQTSNNELDLSAVVRSLSIFSLLSCVRDKTNNHGLSFDKDDVFEPEKKFFPDDESFDYDAIKHDSNFNYEDWAPWLLGLNARDLTTYQFNNITAATSLVSSSYINANGESESSSVNNIDKYLYTIREIVSTEVKFLALMRALIEDFLQPLATVMTLEEKRATNVNIQALYKLHTDLYTELHAVCMSEANRTIKLCNVFTSFQKRFMKEYVDYFVNIEEAIENFNAMIASKRSNNEAFSRTYDSCRANFKYQQCSITLSDLLLQPFQRISKYHLLMKDLRKNRQSNVELRDCIEDCVKRIEATGTYLNEAKRDHECILKIEHAFGALGLPPKLDMGRLVKESICVVGIFKNDTDLLGGMVSKSARTVLLFETSLLIFKRNLFQRYEKVEEFNVNDIKNVKSGLASCIKTNSSSSSSPDIPSSTCLTIVFQPDTNNGKYVEFHFKTSAENELWQEAFSLITPLHRLARNHVFTLCNFDRDIKECGVCGRFLNGIFFQGFKCKFCEINVHRSCLTDNIETCKDNATSKTEHNFRSGSIKIRKPSIIGRSTINQISTMYQTQSQSMSKTLDRKPNMISSVIAHCKSIREYMGKYPSPPTSTKMPSLHFKSNEIIWITENILDNDNENTIECNIWRRGYKLRFNGAVKDLPLYKEEGYFPNSHVQQVDAKECLEIYSWYLNEDKREYAVKVLTRALASDSVSNKCLFLLRPSKAKGNGPGGESSGHSISFTYQNKIFHIKVNMSVWYKNRMKNMGAYFVRHSEENETISEMIKFYDINNMHYFLSLVDLIDYYKENPLDQFLNGQVLSLGVSFREAMPTPMFVAKAVCLPEKVPPLTQQEDMLELRIGEKCFVVKRDNEQQGWVYAFNVNGLLGFVCAHILEEIF